jgi:uncharacterized surface protein with fasciclin (FAS1) repeats
MGLGYLDGGTEIQDPAQNVTVFALDNAAVTALNISSSSNSTSNSNSSTFQYDDYYYTDDAVGYASILQNGFSHVMKSGRKIHVTANRTGKFVNGAMVVSSDVLIDNGVVHVIDK